MCGIAGKIIKSTNGAAGAPFPIAELAAIRRRGPDSTGVRALDCKGYQVHLLHSRLSIIDLTQLSNQPMHDPTSGWWITYNGEIYNYLEVRAELMSRGWTFRSSGDTEVLLKAWVEWGVEALHRLNGMFAFAAFHPQLAELWLVRDRFGVKPLAWGRLPDGGITFSSSVAGVAQQVGDEIDETYCARGLQYKVYDTVDSGSPFKAVKSVAPGSWVRFRFSDQQIVANEGQWYDLSAAVSACLESTMRCSDADLVALCRDRLQEAVRIRLRSDVPVAVSLSGGLDSTSVAFLASRSVPHMKGFTYGAPDAGTSEGPAVRLFSEVTGLDVTYVWPRYGKHDLGDALERTMAFQESPFSGLSLIAQNEVYRAARSENFKVLLGGQGGDELFAGYRKFFIVAMREAVQGHDARNALRLLYSLGLMLAHESGQARMYLENLGRYRKGGRKEFRIMNWQPHDLNLWGGQCMTLTERQIQDVTQWSLPTLLRYEDRNSMGYGVESRLPFMDYRLLELALALPTRLKIRNGYGKWILREIMNGGLPDAIRMNRKKRGFDVTQAWVDEGIGDVLRQTIFDNRTLLSRYMRADVDLDKQLSGERMKADPNLLNEALMLAWLTSPVRRNSMAPAAMDVA